MSNKAITWAFSADLSRSSDKLLLVCLANHANENGLCWPSQPTIAEQTCLDRKTVIAGLRRLIEAGWLHDTGHRRGQSGQVVIYRLVLDRETPLRRFIRDEDIESINHGDGPNIPVVNTGGGGPEIPIAGSQFSHRGVPIFPSRGPENGTRNPNGTLMEPPGNPHLAHTGDSHTEIPSDTEPAPKAKKRPAEKTRIPDGWRPDDAGVAYAATKGIGPGKLDDEVEKFFTYHAGKGNRWKSWPAAWRTWCMNHAAFSRKGGSNRRSDRMRNATNAMMNGYGDSYSGVTIEHETGGYDDASDDPDAWRHALPH